MLQDPLHDLILEHRRLDTGEALPVGVVPVEDLGRLLVRRGNRLDPGTYPGMIELDPVLLDDLGNEQIEGETAPYRLLEHRGVRLRTLRVAPRAGEFLTTSLRRALRLGANHRFGQIELVSREQGLHDALLQHGAQAAGKLALHVRTHFAAQRFDPAIRHPEALGEGVVDFRNLRLLHPPHLHVERHRLACKVLRMALRERKLQRPVVAGPGPDESFLEAVDHAPRVKLHRELRLGSGVERLAVHDGFEIHDHAIAPGRGALDRLPGPALDTDHLEHPVDVLVRNGGHRARNLHRVEPRQGNLREHVERRRIAHPVAGAGLQRRDVRRRGGTKLLLAERIEERFLDDAADHLVAHLPAVVPGDDLDRRLPRTEPGNSDLSGKIPKPLVDLALDALFGDLHPHAPLQALRRFNRHLHVTRLRPPSSSGRSTRPVYRADLSGCSLFESTLPSKTIHPGP